MSDYTKGPWRVGEVVDGAASIIAPNIGPVASVLQYGGNTRHPRGIISYAEMMANAHLISHAPDMIHLLGWLREHSRCHKTVDQQLLRVQVDAFFDRYQAGRP